MKNEEIIKACLTFISTVHAFIAASSATYTVLYLCDYPAAIFYQDKTCFRTYRPFYTHSVVFSLSYFTYDCLF